MTILKSATKITLLLLIVALIAMSFLSIEMNDTFNNVIIAVISFYFGQKMSEWPKNPV